ncbi:MAG: ABC transporter permease [Acidobacteria bacterium]|nr:ABC transporter permease [Acidobacteriota bacterium]
MKTLWQDLRFGARMLFKKPGFTIVAVLTLGLGIGANTAIFSVINAVLLRPLPFPNEKQLVVAQQIRKDKKSDSGGVSYLNFTDWQSQSQSFQSMAIFTSDETTLTGEGEPVRIKGAVVSSDFFKTLGIVPKLGQAFRPADDLPGAGGGFNSVMLTDSAWRNRFAADSKIVGRKITLGETAFTVVGVTPADIIPLQTEPIDYWTTVAVNGDPSRLGTANASRGYPAYTGVIARLKAGATIEQARAELAIIHNNLQDKFKSANAGTGIIVTPLRDLIVGDVRSKLWLLLGIVGIVLLIACVNVANLLLARATTRQREMAIRTALGASRRQIIQQLLSESLLLSLIGSLAGMVISMWMIDLLLAFLPAEVPRITGLEPDWRVFVFTLCAAVFTGILCGLAPAINALKTDLTMAINDGGRGTKGASGSSLLRNSLLVGQIAAALVLMVGAGLLVKSLIKLEQVNPGFETANILTFQMSLSSERYFDKPGKPEKINAFLNELTGHIKILPGVSGVSFAQSVPLTSVENSTSFEIVERPAPNDEKPTAQLRFIGLRYFQILNIPILNGRDFSETDSPQSPPVVIVNEAFAREYFKGEDPMGKRLRLGWGGDAPKEIVGVIGNVRHRGLNDNSRPEMYVPQAQFANAGITLLVSSSVNPSNLIAQIKKDIYSIDPQLPVTDIKTLDEYRTNSVALARFSAFLLGLFALLALLLTVIGLYGVISYSVTQRTREIGIRLAFGAQAGHVLRLVTGEGMRLVGLGVAVGLVASLAVTRLLESWLFNVSATDPLTLIGITIVLVITALPACLIPARSAMKVDPIVALRYE